MNLITYTIPSVIEGNNANLINVARDQLNGLKIRQQDTDYIIGNLALSEGKNPHKAINSSPDERDYQLLMAASLLLATRKAEEPLNVTTGFPYSTYMINKQHAIEHISNIQHINFDSRPYGGSNNQSKAVSINRVEVIPELIAATIGLRNTMNRSGNFFVVSLGYGTVEIGLSTDDGIVQRTQGSANGLRFAINWAKEHLMQKYYVGLRTEHQIDSVFQRGNITVQRKRIDISDIRRDALSHYYENVISPLIRNTWEDADFDRTDTMVLVGGGALYPELVQCFQDEFGSLMNVEVSEDPASMASKGYCLRSSKLAPNNASSAVGIDVGNAHTNITVVEDGGESFA